MRFFRYIKSEKAHQGNRGNAATTYLNYILQRGDWIFTRIFIVEQYLRGIEADDRSCQHCDLGVRFSSQLTEVKVQ